MRVAVLILLISYYVVGEIAVLILARGGSKGVKLKNLQKVNGVSLIGRAVHTAKSAGFEDVTVSTDHPLIAFEALISGAKVFQRSAVTSTDWAPSIWGAIEFIKSRSEVSILVLIQATSPFITARTLFDTVRKIEKPIPVDCVFTVTRSHKLRWRQVQGKVFPTNFKINSRPRRQDWEGELLETGAIYIARRELINQGVFQNNKLFFNLHINKAHLCLIFLLAVGYRASFTKSDRSKVVVVLFVHNLSIS